MSQDSRAWSCWNLYLTPAKPSPTWCQHPNHVSLPPGWEVLGRGVLQGRALGGLHRGKVHGAQAHRRQRRPCLARLCAWFQLWPHPPRRGPGHERLQGHLLGRRGWGLPFQSDFPGCGHLGRDGLCWAWHSEAGVSTSLLGPWLTCPGEGVGTGLLPATSEDPSPPGVSLSNTLEQYLG